MRPWSTLSSLLLVAATSTALAQPGPEREAELRHLLVQDCGSCHGLTLAGGLGPPLRSGDLAGKPAEVLVQTILEGRPGTAMPPWRPFVNPQEAAWLVDQLKRGEAIP
jgi:cytochrome c55X